MRLNLNEWWEEKPMVWFLTNGHIGVCFCVEVPRGHRIHRKWVWLNWRNVAPSWGRIQSGDTMDKPLVQKIPNYLGMFPKFYIQNFMKIKHMNFLMLKREAFQTSIKSKTMEIFLCSSTQSFYTEFYIGTHTLQNFLKCTMDVWKEKGFCFIHSPLDFLFSCSMSPVFKE